MRLLYYNGHEADNNCKGRHAIFTQEADRKQWESIESEEPQQITIREYESDNGPYIVFETSRFAFNRDILDFGDMLHVFDSKKDEGA